MRTVQIDVTVNSSGDGTAYSSGVSGGGVLYAVQLVDSNLADGVDLVLTSEQRDLSIPLLTIANFNSDQMVYPRVPTAAIADGSALTDYAEPVIFGRIKAVIAQGGNATSGSVICYIRDL